MFKADMQVLEISAEKGFRLLNKLHVNPRPKFCSLLTGLDRAMLQANALRH